MGDRNAAPLMLPQYRKSKPCRRKLTSVLPKCGSIAAFDVLSVWFRAVTQLTKAAIAGLLAAGAVVVGVPGLSDGSTAARANNTVAAAGRAAGAWAQAAFPVENFQAYTSPFGYRRSPTGGGRQFHRGLDLAAPMGSIVRNWWGGTVVDLKNDRLCGTMVRIRSGRWEHVYCHLQGRVETAGGYTYLRDRYGGAPVVLGRPIPTGAVVGRVGTTGRSTGPHLHWGLRYDGQLIDPALVLRAMAQQGSWVPARAAL